MVSIQVDDIISRVLSSDNTSDTTNYPEIDFTHDKFEFNNINDDLEDEVIFGGGYYIGEDKSVHGNNPNEDTFVSNEDTFAIETKSTENGGKSSQASSLVAPTVSTADHGSNNSCEDVTSDSSTLCPESVSPDQLNKKYNEKVRELIQEQNQYLQDLNVLRRIFVVLFKRCCHLFGIKLNSSESEEMSDEIENMFGKSHLKFSKSPLE